MTPTQYRTERRKRGTQVEVARALGITARQIRRRETGEQPVNREAAMALLALPERRAK